MRDPTIPVWPDEFRPRQITTTIDRPIFKGPKPLDGREQVVAASAGGWAISYEGVPVYGPWRHPAFRPLWLKIAALGKPVYVRPDFLSSPTPAATKFSDATTFSDLTSFAQSTGDCVLAAAAARGARTITVTNSVASPVTIGSYFELDGRAHLVQDIDGTKWTIWPSLRADYASGTVLEIDDPRVVAYLTPDSRGMAMTMDARQVTFMNLDFVEASW